MTTSAELDQWIDDSGQVSLQQREAVYAEGNFFLLSRPGSGKTRIAGIRTARLAMKTPAIRVAATSYTNVAIRQIEATTRERGVVLGSRHFTGTIHQFLLQYVLYPFGGLLEIKEPLHLLPDETWPKWPQVVYHHDPKKRLSVASLHYTASGDFRVQTRLTIGLTSAEAELSEIDQVRACKEECRQRGLVSFSDAMFYAQQILEDYPEVCSAVAERFDEIIVDEAQDTSDVQLRCLELLHETGKLRSLVLIGDMDQSIYSFQGAHPELCEALVKKCGLAEIPLTQNFRSSQQICNVTCRFCGRTEPDEAVGPHQDCAVAPEIIVYDPKNPPSAVEHFQRRLQAHGIDENCAVVLARRRSFRDKINGVSHPEGMHSFVVALGRLCVAAAEQRTFDRDELRRVEGDLARMAWGDRAMLDDGDMHLQMRHEVMTLLRDLPDLALPLDQWIGAARERVKQVLAALVAEPVTKAQYVVKSKGSFAGVTAMDAFSGDQSPLRARTVHDVKGESHASVLLVVQPRYGQSDQAGLWSQPLLGEEVEEALREELRIAYVALTRAERYCAVAVPANVDEGSLQAYLAAGFVRV